MIGLGDGENFLGSDVAAFVEHTRRAVAIGQDQIVTITAQDVAVTDFDGNPVDTDEFTVAWDASAAEKGGWDSFMAKEISEEPDAVANTLLGRIVDGAVHLPELDGLGAVLADIDRIVILGCGTASYSGMLGKYAIEKWARIPVEVDLSHEFRYRDPMLDARTLVVSISQSGETMDTLMAVKYARQPARTRCPSATRRAPRSPGSRTPWSTRTPAPRWPSRPPRPSSRRSPRCTCSACTSAAVRGTLPDDRIAGCSRSCRRSPARLARC